VSAPTSTSEVDFAKVRDSARVHGDIGNVCSDMRAFKDCVSGARGIDAGMR
jgi:hypothetical protein